MIIEDDKAVREELFSHMFHFRANQCCFDLFVSDTDTSVMRREESLTLGHIYTEIFNQYLWDGNGYHYILILPDCIAEKYTIHNICYAVTTKEPLSEVQ